MEMKAEKLCDQESTETINLVIPSSVNAGRNENASSAAAWYSC